MPDIDETFKLGRTEDDIVTTSTEPEKKTKGKTQPAVTHEEMQAVKLENAELRVMLQHIQAQLSVGAPVQMVVPAQRMLDKTRPYSKTRTSGGGVTFEQDGRTFNARGALTAE